MLKLVNLKKLTSKTLIGILVAGSFISQAPNRQANADTSSPASDDVQGLELRYLDSAFQCGADGNQADIKVKVYRNDTLLTTMSKEDTFTISDVDSVNDLSFKYQFTNISCRDSDTLYDLRGSELLGSEDTVPDVGGAYGQASITEMLSNLDNYEELFLVELGSSSSTRTLDPGWYWVNGKWKYFSYSREVINTSYDLQDVVFVVDNNPDSLQTPIVPPAADGDVDNNGILDSQEIDSDIDNDGLKNFEDLDDDGDNIADVHELYTPSEISSTGTKVMTHKLSDGNEISVTLPNPPSTNLVPASARNTDNTDEPDYQDPNTDNDKFSDAVEAGDTDLATAPFNSDSSISGDSLADFRDLDSDDNGIIDDNEIDSDVDIDGTKNFQDLDDDNDGIIDLIEIGSDPANPTNSDNNTSSSDKDDYQDTDSDDDFVLDSVEGVKSSADGTTPVYVTYPNSNGASISYNLQDSSITDTKKDGSNCVGTTEGCTVTSTSAAQGKVTITGTMTGLDYQVPAFAD